MINCDKFLWVCELNKDKPSMTWRAGDIMELEDDEDKDYVINSIVLKTAVLGAKAVDGERNLVAIKTKGYQDKEFEQPVFSLTLGRQDMVSGLDLTLASDHNPEVEFKLIVGTGPVFVTCTHLIEMPSHEEHPTLMTNSDMEECEESEDVEESDDDKAAKNKKNGVKNGDGLEKNVTNGKKANGDHANGNLSKEDIEIDEKPNKRKRN